MPGGPPFIDRKVFERVLGEISTADGAHYQDAKTIYGDLSRLIVAWLASTPPSDINDVYNKLGWKGVANGRALHESAKHWMRRFRSESESGRE